MYTIFSILIYSYIYINMLNKYFLLKYAKSKKDGDSGSSTSNSTKSSSPENTNNASDHEAYDILSKRMADEYNTPRLKELPYIDTRFKVNRGFNDAYSPHLSDQDVMFPLKGLANIPNLFTYRRANRYGIRVDPNDMASASILLGNAATRYNTNFHGNDYISPFTKIMKEIGFTVTGLNRTKDYIDSWDAIKKIYKDHPDVIKDFNYLRDRAARAQFKMDMADIIPRYSGGILGAYLGYKFGRPIKRGILRHAPRWLKFMSDVGSIGGGFLLGSALSLLLTKSLRNGYNRAAASLREDPNYKFYNDRLQRRIKEIGRNG